MSSKTKPVHYLNLYEVVKPFGRYRVGDIRFANDGVTQLAYLKNGTEPALMDLEGGSLKFVKRITEEEFYDMKAREANE